MSHRLRVSLCGSDGEPIGGDGLGTLYASDLHFEPERRSSEIGPDGVVEIEAPDFPVALHACIAVHDFGILWVTADAEGEGYGPTAATIDFVGEAAASRLADVRRVLAEPGVAWSAECRAHEEAAADFMVSGHMASGARRAELHMLALSHGLWAGELAVVERARHTIAQRAKRDGFLLGCNTFATGPHVDEIRAEFSQVLNFGTLPFYLAALERAEGEPDYSTVDENLAWCEREGIKPKGHPLWWGHEAGVPHWLSGVDWAGAQANCRRVASRSVERYRDRIKTWDAINEAHDWANGLNLTQEQEIEITRLACDTVRECDPEATVIVNNCCPFGEYAADGVVHVGPVYDRILTPLAYLDRVADAGIDYDVVGVQIYFPVRDMLAVGKLLDEYARFGKPVHITELGVSSAPRIPHDDEEEQLRRTYGDWHQRWCEKVQADWLEWFYTMAYARPEIEAITWWDFADPAFIFKSGLVTEDGTPKEAYHRLGALLSAWGFGK